MIKRICQIFIISAFLLAKISAASAETACAKVTLEILQELTIERVAFDAKLVLTNNLPDKDLTNIRVDVQINDKDGNVKNDIFFIKLSSTSNITDVSGTGVVPAGTKAEAHWLIIPSPGAGGTGAAGIDYWAGATLTYTVAGKQEIVPINPDKITVKPTAQLVLDYFMPFAVLGDNPFTKAVEPPIPYELAVRVVNDGYGPATNLKIDSAQPKITSNDQGLLVDFKLLGASVNDSAVSPSLAVNMGTVGSKKIATAYWEMISTLSGRFTQFDVSFTHSSELGGELTSLIKETNAHYLTHRVKVNLPGRDNLLDFLADTDGDNEHLPDAIFESEIPGGSTDIADSRSPVTAVSPVSSPARPTPENPSVNVTISMPANTTGWIYTKMSDPSQGNLELLDVVRADGVHLDPHNFWVDKGLDKDYQTIYTLQFVDFRGSENTTAAYTLVFKKPDADTIPPTTTIIFDGPDIGTDTVYITPQTRIVFTAKDNDGGSGVDAMYKKLAGEDADFAPALPFNLTTPKSYTLEYYSTDRNGNKEAAKSANIVVDNSPPVISSFTATPSAFTPYAPDGVKADRAVNFVINASDTVGTMQAKIEIINSNGAVIRTLTGTAQSGIDLSLTWDGKDNSGKLAPVGAYTAKLSVSDGLDNPNDPSAPSHTTTREINIAATEWFTESPLDANTNADQMHVSASGKRVVWQDKRNGDWDIYMKDVSSGVVSRITNNSSDQEFPSIDGDIIVWQDMRNGNSDIYGYDLSNNQEIAVATGVGEQEKPVVSGAWVVWQDRRNGNWDIYAKNISTNELIQITSHERDQIRPAISGNSIVWEDYRHGFGEIYKYDITTRTETRITVDIDNQTLPAVSGAGIVWTDQRNGQKDIYRYDPSKGILRVTYGAGDHTDAAVSGNLLVYTDYESGVNDPNLSFQELTSSRGGRLTSNPARQEEPALGTGFVVWQDNRGGAYQIYKAELNVEPMPVQVNIRPGFNLIAAGGKLANLYPKASEFIAANNSGIAITKALSYDSLHNTYIDAAGSDFNLIKGMGLVVYADREGIIDVADNGEEAVYTLLPGTNQIGILSIPSGYSAYDLMNSAGLENIQGVRRFDNSIGAWQTVSTRNTGAGIEMVGSNFTIFPGDGLVITMKKRIDGWKP